MIGNRARPADWVAHHPSVCRFLEEPDCDGAQLGRRVARALPLGEQVRRDVTREERISPVTQAEGSHRRCGIAVSTAWIRPGVFRRSCRRRPKRCSWRCWRSQFAIRACCIGSVTGAERGRVRTHAAWLAGLWSLSALNTARRKASRMWVL